MPADRPRSSLQFLPRQEIWVCFGVYMGILISSLYTVYCASVEKADILSFDLKPGWILGRRRDASDFEWSYWPRFYRTYGFWFVGHAVLSWLARGPLFSGARRRSILFLYTLVAMSDILSIKLVTFLLCQCCVVYLVALFGQRRILIWAASLVILSTLNFKITIDYLRALCNRQGQYSALMFTMAIFSMRYISFGVDMCENAEAATATGAAAGDRDDCRPVAAPSPPRTITFFEAVSFVFYFPCFMSGPFISFRDFHEGMQSVAPVKKHVTADAKKQANADGSIIAVAETTAAEAAETRASPSCNRWPALVTLLKDIVHLAIVAVGIEVALHWLYFSALLQEEYYLISAGNMTVFSLSFVQASFFHAKYVVMYGLTSAFMRFDGIQPPDAPCCLTIQYSSSEIWRKFDVGLYNFVKQYMYIPLGGSAHGLSWQMITSFVCFAFISFWHGMDTHIYVWAAVNYVTVVMEKMHSLVLKTQQWRSFVESVGPTIAAHVHLVARVPICILSLWSMFLFLGQTHVGYNLYKKIIRNGGPESHFGLLVLAYCVLVGLMGFHEGVIPGLERSSRDHGKVKKGKGKK